MMRTFPISIRIRTLLLSVYVGVQSLWSLTAASAQPSLPDAGSSPASATPSSGPASPIVPAATQAIEPRAAATCVEHVPEGKARPDLSEGFPARGLSGHVARLRLTLTHGKGERVLTDAFDLQRESAGAQALRAAGFEFPVGASKAAPRVTRVEREADASTTIEIPIIPLPAAPGRHELILPPLPVAMARASGDVITVCSSPHPIIIDDPTANQPNAKPKGNADALRQRELWVGLRNVVYGALMGLGLALLVGLLFAWWKKRPRPVTPPSPPRPAWEVALEALHDIRHADLIAQGRLTAHLERVNHVLREYLGGRYSFDGLESTTEEVLVALRRSALPAPLFVETERMLRESDLVKFADAKPTESQCADALDGVESLVRRTMHDNTAPIEEPESSVPTTSGAAPSPPRATSTRDDARTPEPSGGRTKE